MHHPVFPILENAVLQKAFTAWSYANSDIAMSTFFADEVRLPHSGLSDLNGVFHPVFDLSSLTKPLFLGQILRQRFASNDSILQEPLTELLDDTTELGALLLPFFHTAPTLTLLHLLNHRSGLPPWIWFGSAHWSFKDSFHQKMSQAHWDTLPKGGLKQNITRNLTIRCLQFLNADRVNVETIYSDLNYFLLARVLECLKSNRISSWKNELSALNMHCKSNFQHASIESEKARQCVPVFAYQVQSQSEANDFALCGPSLFGPIHDTNANILASLGSGESIVSGHAGLTGDILDISHALQQISRCEFSTRPNPDERFFMGFDTASNINSQAGLCNWPLNRNKSIMGHLGYSGTSFWLQQNLEESSNHHGSLDQYILLTNRTAQRLHLGCGHIPRLTVVSNLKSQEYNFFMSNQKKSLNPLSEDDFYAEIYLYQNQKIIWDESRLNKPTDVSELRRTCGKLTWMT